MQIIAKKWKLRVYSAIVLSQLLYGLETLWIPATEIHMLEVLYHKHLRTIAGYKHPFFAIVKKSNLDILRETKMPLLPTLKLILDN